MQENQQTRNTTVGGLLLIAAGIFFLLQNMGWFGELNELSDLVWTGIFGVGALSFLYIFFSRPQAQWWAAIPGFALLGLTGVIFLDTFGPDFIQPLTGSLFMGSIGIGFLLIYLVNREMWWAIIPAGVLTTIAVVAGLEDVQGLDSGGVFFMGLGLTFLILGLLAQRTHEPQAWAFIPATVLLIMGILIGTNWIGFINVLWPFALIAAGGYWIWHSRTDKHTTALSQKPSEKHEAEL